MLITSNIAEVSAGKKHNCFAYASKEFWADQNRKCDQVRRRLPWICSLYCIYCRRCCRCRCICRCSCRCKRSARRFFSLSFVAYRNTTNPNLADQPQYHSGFFSALYKTEMHGRTVSDPIASNKINNKFINTIENWKTFRFLPKLNFLHLSKLITNQ